MKGNCFYLDYIQKKNYDQAQYHCKTIKDVNGSVIGRLFEPKYNKTAQVIFNKAFKILDMKKPDEPREFWIGIQDNRNAGLSVFSLE